MGVNVCITAAIIQDEGRKQEYVAGSFPVSLNDVDSSDVYRVASGTVLDHRLNEIPFEIVMYEGDLWRPMLGGWTAQRGHLTAELMARHTPSMNSDNPIHRAIASINPKATVLGRSAASQDTDSYRQMADAIHAATKDVMIVGGHVYRQCVDPTWIVRQYTYIGEPITVLQIDLGDPGRSSDAVWFSGDRQEDALAFAREWADAGGTRLIGPRGTIVYEPGHTPSFDDVSFAARRIFDLYSPRNVVLAGAQMTDDLDEALKTREHQSEADEEGVDAALRLGEVLAEQSHVPGVAVILKSGEAARLHTLFCRGRGLLSQGDYAVLDSMRFG